MDNTTAYLAVLARIMQEERAETTTGSWEHYEKLYALVHTDLMRPPCKKRLRVCWTRWNPCTSAPSWPAPVAC